MKILKVNNDVTESAPGLDISEDILKALAEFRDSVALGKLSR